MDALHDKLLSEATFKFTRSSGKGGQNVNKVSSKAELYFDIAESSFLNDEQKTLLLEKLATKLSANGVLKLTASEARTQLENKEIVKEKFVQLIKKTFHQKKKRLPTKIPKAVIEKRLDEKKKTGELKKIRSKNFE
jgi:ribosome-associated protein